MRGWILYGCRAFVGLVFCVSAVLKLLSIDSFELYLYSLDWFPLTLSFYLARLLIVFEFSLGIALAANVFTKLVNMASYAILFLFSLFLIYLISIGYDGNCHCMGERIDLPPIPSLIKNVVLFALIFVSSCGAKMFDKRQLRVDVPLIAFAALLTVFIVSPPDGIRSTKPAVVHDDEVNLFESKDASFKSFVSSEPKELVCIFSTSCHVCKLAAKKMQLMALRYKVPVSRIRLLFRGEEHSRKVFCENAHLSSYSYLMLEDEQFGKLVGMVPAFLYFENGKLVNKYTYRSLTEDVIASLAD